jgi:hypothetical protein
VGGDQLAPPCASNSNLNIAKLHLPHQNMPSRRLPGFHQSHFRPLVSFLVKPQAHEIERRWRRSSFDCGGPERRASPGRLKLPLHGQHAEAAMRFANPEFSESQSPTGASIASKRAAKATTGPAGPELGFLGRFEKRSRSRLAAAVVFSSLAQSGLLAPTPCFACEEIPIRHAVLGHEKLRQWRLSTSAIFRVKTPLSPYDPKMSAEPTVRIGHTQTASVFFKPRQPVNIGQDPFPSRVHVNKDDLGRMGRMGRIDFDHPSHPK